MKDWKGQYVSIMALRGMERAVLLRLLDTDVMADVFDKYPPSEGWCISLIPLKEPEGGQA